MKISALAASISLTASSVAPPWGEKWTVTCGLQVRGWVLPVETVPRVSRVRKRIEARGRVLVFIGLDFNRKKEVFPRVFFFF